MDNNKNQELMVVKESIIDKIKKFFKNLFSKNKIELKEQIYEQKNEKEEFINSVKIEEDAERRRLINLQNLILEDLVEEEELPQEDIQALHELYNKQILELKDSINDYKQKILKLRMNISE